MTECKAPLQTGEEVTSSPSAPGACLLLGAAAALLLAALPDAVLLPAVDRLPPRQLGLVVVAGLFACGILLGERRATRGAVGRGTLLALGALAAAGCFLSAWLVPPVRERVGEALRGDAELPYYLPVALASALVAAPAALPLGALIAPCLGRQRFSAAALLLGTASGWLVAPWLLVVLLGPPACLQVAGLLCAAAALLLAERDSRTIERRALPVQSVLALPLAGAALLMGMRLLEEELERGALVEPWLVAAVAACAALGSLLRNLPSAPALLGAAAVALPAAFPAATWIEPVPVRDALHELLRVALVGGPTGLLLGALLASRPRRGARGISAGWAPLLLVLLAPVATLWLLPAASPRLLLTLGAVPLLLACCEHPREQLVGILALLAAGALSLSGVGPSPPPGACPAQRTARLRDGSIALVKDPATGQQLLALDGRAPFGRSADQMRRMAHIPLQLHGPVDRVLVVAADRGETATAAWANGPKKMHWLQPFQHPDDWPFPPWPGEDPPTSGPERQFLAVNREPYDVILMAPDPRAGRRAELLGTQEFFALADARLAPKGLFCQWWDLADVDISDLKSVIASAHEVFPCVYLATDHPRTRRACVALMACHAPLQISPDALDASIAAHGLVADDLAAVGLDGFSLTCLMCMDGGLLELFAPRDDALHDDRPTLAIRGALRPTGMAERLAAGLAAIADHRREPTTWVSAPDDERRIFDAISRDRYRSWQHLFGGAIDVVRERGPAGPTFDREALGDAPEVEAEHFLPALAGLPDWDWLRDQVIGFARRLEREGRVADAEHYLRRAVDEADQGSAALRYALASLVERKGDKADALLLYRTVLAFDPQHAGALQAVDRLAAGK